MRDNYARAVAVVDNYTVVQTSSVTGSPEVVYYEKEIINYYPVIRIVGPSELANREGKERGDRNTPEYTASEISDFFQRLGWG